MPLTTDYGFEIVFIHDYLGSAKENAIFVRAVLQHYYGPIVILYPKYIEDLLYLQN